MLLEVVLVPLIVLLVVLRPLVVVGVIILSIQTLPLLVLVLLIQSQTCLEGVLIVGLVSPGLVVVASPSRFIIKLLLHLLLVPVELVHINIRSSAAVHSLLIVGVHYGVASLLVPKLILKVVVSVVVGFWDLIRNCVLVDHSMCFLQEVQTRRLLLHQVCYLLNLAILHAFELLLPVRLVVVTLVVQVDVVASADAHPSAYSWNLLVLVSVLHRLGRNLVGLLWLQLIIRRVSRLVPLRLHKCTEGTLNVRQTLQLLVHLRSE